MYFFHEAFQCLSTVERNALFNKARAREQCMPFTFNHQLLVSCLGNQVFKGAQALESTSQSGCWWALSSFETWSSHSWWKLLDWTRFFWGFVLEKIMFSISMGTLWLVKFTAQFFHLLTVFQEHLNLAGALKLMFVGALSSVPVALSAAALRTQGSPLWLTGWFVMTLLRPSNCSHGELQRKAGVLARGIFLPGTNGTGYCFAWRAYAGGRLLGCCHCCEVASRAFHKVFFIPRTISSAIKLTNKVLGGASWDLLQKLDASKIQLHVAKGKDQ